MATCPTDSATYQEEIRTFRLNGVDGITIPKEVREEAYELAIDIFIVSIAKETYKNYECTPPESFYGSATLVFQDALDLKIPIKFPRQRIYYGRVPEAFEQWNALINFEYQRAYFLAVGESLQSLGTALGAGSIPAIFCCSLPEPTWRELPLREVYFHSPIGTQFLLEVTWLKPVAFSDSCNTFYDGTSKQVDGDKDAGLPPNGIFPNIAEDIDDPYAGLPNATTDGVQGAFSNSKTANLGDDDPAYDYAGGLSTYPISGWGAFAELTGIIINNNVACQRSQIAVYYLCNTEDVLTITSTATFPNTCGSTYNTINLVGSISGALVTGASPIRAYAARKVYSPSLPPNVITPL